MKPSRAADLYTRFLETRACLGLINWLMVGAINKILCTCVY